MTVRAYAKGLEQAVAQLNLLTGKELQEDRVLTPGTHERLEPIFLIDARDWPPLVDFCLRSSSYCVDRSSSSTINFSFGSMV